MDDNRTDLRDELTWEDDTTSKTPRRPKLANVLAVVFAAGTIVLLVTTVVFAVQKNNIATELDKLKANGDLCTTKQCFDSAYVYLSTMDQSQNPCDNFFEYACGGWTKRYTGLDDKTSFTIFNLLIDDLTYKLKVLVERTPNSSDPVSFQTVGADYKSCIDLETINSLGATPLTDVLTSLGGWPVLGDNLGGNWEPANFDFEKLWADLRGKYNIDMIIATNVWPDIYNTTQYKLKAFTPTFSALKTDIEKRQWRDVKSLIEESEDSDDYGAKVLLDENHVKKKQAYLQYLVDIAVALGADEAVATEDMTNVIEFETTVANLSILHGDSIPVETTLGEIGMNEIDWVDFYAMMLPPSVTPNVTASEPIVNYRTFYVGNVTMWLKDQPDRVKANYMIWRLVNSMVPYLNETFLAIRQKFIDAIQGTSTSERWKTCVNNVNNQYEFITGRMYVDDHFPEEAKQKTLDMIRNLQTAFKSMLTTNDWLQEGDKVLAAEKANAMQVAIGYPEWIKDNAKLDEKYSDLASQAEDEFFQNNLRYRTWISQSALALLRKPVVRSVWSSGPATINAFYNPSKNGILFPAGILQPPFYHKDLPWYSNYGGIGVVIGHEITHGFDNSGRLFDKDGNLRLNLWSLPSIYNFYTRAKCIINQYSSFVMPENNKNLNGEQTQGENIADNGGLRESHKAYMDFIPKQPRLPGIDFTEEQMFFLSFSQLWCSVFTPAGANNSIDNDVHSPGRYRVIGTLQNNEAFSAAFNCPAGSYMNPNNKCKVW